MVLFSFIVDEANIQSNYLSTFRRNEKRSARYNYDKKLQEKKKYLEKEKKIRHIGLVELHLTWFFGYTPNFKSCSLS